MVIKSMQITYWIEWWLLSQNRQQQYNLSSDHSSHHENPDISYERPWVYVIDIIMQVCGTIEICGLFFQNHSEEHFISLL